MSSGTSSALPPGTPSHRRFGTDVGEPPLFGDPRRWGSLVALAGGLGFIGYSPALGAVACAIAWTVGISLVLASLWAHYLHPVSLGPLARPRPLALAAYAMCVVGELSLIAVGSRTLDAAGRDDLRPALIAAVVGFHFIPFYWAFGERMFLWLGGVVAMAGAVGLGLGALSVPKAADGTAVIAGLVMLATTTLYALGRFVPSSVGQPVE
jgi:hypothetical protein